MFLRRLGYIGSICLLALGGCSTDDSTLSEEAVSIEKMSPSQVSRGQRGVKGVITGNNFVGVVLVNLGEGVDLQETSVVSPTTLSITFSVHPDAKVGPRDVTITTPSGTVRNSEIFSVSDNAMPTAHFTVTPSQGGKNSPFSFDASSSSDSDGTIKTYDWNFGDGSTASGQTTTHGYASGGVFQVTLTVTDDAQGKATATQSLTVVDNEPPAAHYTVLPRNGNTSTVFSFDGSGSKDDDGRITEYKWDFRDGHNGEGEKITHQFQHDGTYSVTLTVTDNGSLRSSVAQDVQIIGEPPIAGFSVSPPSGPRTTNFRFDASASHDPDGRINDYAWDFDDGTAKNGKIADHQFSTEGDYSVNLTVTDNDGTTSSAQKTVRVASSGGGEVSCPSSEQIVVDDGGLKPFCNSFKLPRTFGPDHPVTVIGIHDPKEHRVMDIRVYNGDSNQDYCCQNVFYLCTEFRSTSGSYVFGASAFEIGPYGEDSNGYYRDYYLYRAGAESFGQWPPAVGTTLFSHFVPCE